jgi:hypothetical protein
MGRLIAIVFMLIISVIIYLVKAGVGKVTGNDVNFKDESQKVMQKTAKGINWMNEQWEKAKTGTNNQYLTSGGFSNMSATEIIATVKVNPTKYDKASAETIYIEQAIAKMNNRQFDDAKKLIMQVSEGEGRDYMLNEIEQKRNG